MSEGERMHDKIKKMMATLAVLMVAFAAGVAVAPAPAQANINYCYTSSICAYPSVTTWPAGSPWVINRDVADAPRNTCFAEFGTVQTFAVINNSAFRWYLFRTSACSGSHIEVGPYDEIQTPSGWSNIHAWYRTSTTS